MTIRGDLIESLEKIHDASMSKDPITAAQGRCAKEVMNAFFKWFDDEKNRGTDPYHMLLASAGASISILTTAFVNVTPPDKTAPSMQRFTPKLHALWEYAINDVANHHL
jgi:hypothetical protein